MLTGPGVDDIQITLGTLVDSGTDRGFLQGLQLWKESVNAAGGICGRTITIVSSGTGEFPAGLTDAYRKLGTQVLGFVTQTSSSDVAADLATLLSADQMPALTTTGTANDLLNSSPVVIGPTDDIIAINAVDQLRNAGQLAPGDRLGVVSDGSAAALNAVQGLRWFAELADLTLVIQTVNGRDTDVLAELPAVVALGTQELTATLAAELPASTTVLTTLDGYDPALLNIADAAHVEVALSTPAVGSDHPGARAVETAIAANGSTPGALTFAGYASGATWQRLLASACDAQSLTRTGLLTALTTIGSASVDSLLGATNPSLPVLDQQPASRSSALAAADLTTPTGLRPLTGLIVADGIDDYSAPVR